MLQYIGRASSPGSIDRVFSWSPSSAWHWVWPLRALLPVFKFPSVFSHLDQLVLVIHWFNNSAGCFWIVFVRNMTIQQEEAYSKTAVRGSFPCETVNLQISCTPLADCSFLFTLDVLCDKGSCLQDRDILSLLTSQSNLGTLTSEMSEPQVPASYVLVLASYVERESSVLLWFGCPAWPSSTSLLPRGKLNRLGCKILDLPCLLKSFTPGDCLLFLARWYMNNIRILLLAVFTGP